MPRKKNPVILLVDDEPVVRFVAADALASKGFAVIEVESADQALAVLKSRADIGLLFTDITCLGVLTAWLSPSLSMPTGPPSN
jgi:CheY-like chemotaxis protein